MDVRSSTNLNHKENQAERFYYSSGDPEDDWDYWPQLREALGSGVLVVGDDLLCTNPARVRRAAAAGATTGLLLKVNQVGTLTEAQKPAWLRGRQQGGK